MLKRNISSLTLIVLSKLSVKVVNMYDDKVN